MAQGHFLAQRGLSWALRPSFPRGMRGTDLAVRNRFLGRLIRNGITLLCRVFSKSYDPLWHTPLGSGGHNMDSQIHPNPKRQAFFNWGPGIGDFGTSSKHGFLGDSGVCHHPPAPTSTE